jgi:hypothetical protein
MTMKTAETIIRELAARHGVAVQRTALDDWADDATRLSGDDGVLDGVGELVVALRRARAVDGIELTRLHSRYLDELDAA